jgi:two-component system, NtrC family, sensor kinase
MKKYYFVLLLISLLPGIVSHTSAQDNSKEKLLQNPTDSNEVKRLIGIAGKYRFSKPDSSILLAKAALSLARQLNFTRGEAGALITLGEDHRLGGDFPQALESLFSALQIGRNISDPEIEANSLDFIGIAYVDLGESRQGLHYLFQAKKINEQLSLTIMNCFGLSNIGRAYEQLNLPDSALLFEEQAFQLQQKIFSPDLRSNPLKSLILRQLGNIQNRLGNYDKALSYYREVIGNEDLLNISNSQYHIADYFFTIRNNPDSGLSYALPAFSNSQKSLQKASVLEASKLLARLYKAKNKLDSAYYYHEIAMKMNDSLFGPEKFHQLQLLAIHEQQGQQELQQEKENFKNKTRLYVLLAIVGVFLLLAIIFYRNYRQKQGANVLLQQQKKEIQNTLIELRSTQSQLIQSEKMASLGELTAGIAHEIQNPLNFVNNFSEVNTELIEELKIEAQQEKKEEVIAIANDIKANEEKITHHGKRADAIVKSMLQHSQISSGVKEPSNINALADESLRLSYQGLRAKDNSFTITIKTDFDETMGNINIIPQDIGRVLRNLYNNAFYAALLPSRQVGTGAPDKIGSGFTKLQIKHEPTVWVSTKKVGDRILLSIRDNGPGIPQNILDKIFQPFFTTKPTGQGTGLGLSLSYDIIKAHGGELKVETKEGEGAEFIIQLPIN